MILRPRDYQEKCHNDILTHIGSKESNKPSLAVIGTGGGKSLNIAMLAMAYDKNILVLCPSQEILAQNYKKFTDMGGEACIYSASFKSKDICKVTYATLGSIKKNASVFKSLGFKMLCVDEAHIGTDQRKGMFKDFVSVLSPDHTIGFTATPFVLKNYSDPSGFNYSQLTMMNRLRPKFFSKISHVTQIPYLVESGFWAPVEVHTEEFNPLGLIYNSTGSDYTDSSISIAVKKNNVNNRIYKLTKNLISDGVSSILIFLDTVENCYIMSGALGKMAAVVEAKTPIKERRDIIEKFKAGDIKVITCVSTLSTGFDFPQLTHVIMGRPTGSLAVFYQIYGRLVRPFEGKEAHFYDFGGNIKKFGRMETMTIEDFKPHGWGVFNNDELLTGKTMNGEPIFKKDLLNMPKAEFRNSNCPYFEFGLYKNKSLKDIPISYLQWACENAKNNMSKVLWEACKKIIATK